MDSNWLAVLGVLLVVLAGGLAFVAFTHPAAFRENLGIPLAFLTAVAFIVLSFWNLGALHAQSEALLCAVKSQDRAASETVAALAQKLRDTYRLEVYGLFIAAAVIAYLFFLSRLPQLGLVRENSLAGAEQQPLPSEPISSAENAPNRPR